MRTGLARVVVAALVSAVLGGGCLVVGTPEVVDASGTLRDINADGVAVGSRGGRAYVVDTVSGEARTLGPADVGSRAFAVNDHGIAVGSVDTARGKRRAHLWDTADGTPVDIGTPAALWSSEANDINDDGVVVGWREVPGGAHHAFVRDPATGVMRDLGTLGGTSSEANAISDAGIVVGSSTVDGDVERHAFAFDLATGVMTDLGTLGGRNASATDVNEHGIVVGWSEIPGDYPIAGPQTRAFAHDLATGVTTDLKTLPGDTHSYASGLNDEGIVVGRSIDWHDVRCASCPPLNEHAAVWELGTSGRYRIEGDRQAVDADAVNDDGLVLGRSLVVLGYPVWFTESFVVQVTRVEVADEPAG